jgi:hypothetical protein
MLALFVLAAMAGTVLLLVGGFVAFVLLTRKPSPTPSPERRTRTLPVSAAPPTSPAHKPMRVMRMRTSGFLRMTNPAGVKHEEPLPRSPYGSGEFPTACWSPGDGSVYAVGKLYSGKPGPDHGFVYHRAANGTWSVAHVIEQRTFHSIVGRSDRELYVGAMGGVVYFDGARWTFIEMPYPMVVKVFADAGDIIAQAFDGSITYQLDAGRPTPTMRREAPDSSPYSHASGGMTYRVFDRSEEVGEEDLSAAEEAELRGQLDELGKAVRAGHAKVRPYEP